MSPSSAVDVAPPPGCAPLSLNAVLDRSLMLKAEDHMAKRWLAGVAVAITLLSFLPVGVHAGVGGSPIPPGAAAAGSSTTYCCTSWTPVEVGDNKAAITVFDGAGCKAISDTASEKNDCPAKVLKCRGEEFQAPGGLTMTGTVKRCLAP